MQLYAQKGRTEIIPSRLVISSRLRKFTYEGPRLFMWEVRRDKKQNMTIFFLPLYEVVFNRDGIARRNGIISIPPFSA